MPLDESVLDDQREVTTRGGPLLAATAAAGSGLREAITQVDPDCFGPLIVDGRPRAVVVAGAGGSSAAGDILAACAGNGSAVPVVTIGGPSLPGWVGPLDAVITLSASGASAETLSVAVEAARRGSRLIAIGFSGPLLDQVADMRGAVVSLRRPDETLPARALTWRMAAPLLLLAERLGVVAAADAALEQAAEVLESVAVANGPARRLGDNEAKELAIEMAESLPLVWGTPDVPAAVCRRVARQFAENAGLPVLPGSLPEVARTHARVLAGAWAPDDDIFRDRVEQPDAPRPRLMLLQDDLADPLSLHLSHALQRVAEDHGVPVRRLEGGSGHPLVRFARLTETFDLASIYAAVALGLDPADTARGLHPDLGAKG